MSSSLTKEWKEDFEDTKWASKVKALPFGGMEAYIAQHDVIMNKTYKTYSTAPDKKDRTWIKLISKPEEAFMVFYRRQWRECTRFNRLKPVGASVQRTDMIVTSFGVDRQKRLCGYTLAYITSDGKPETMQFDDDHGMVIVEPMDAIRGLYLWLYPLHSCLEAYYVTEKTKEKKAELRDDLFFTQHQIMLLMKWLSIDELAIRPTDVSPAGCNRFISLSDPQSIDDEKKEIIDLTTTTTATATESKPLVPPPTTTTPAQTATTSTSSAVLEKMVTKETSEQQPSNNMIDDADDYPMCKVPTCGRTLFCMECNRCEPHCDCKCPDCKKFRDKTRLLDGKSDPCTCVQPGGASTNEDRHKPKSDNDSDDESPENPEYCHSCGKTMCDCKEEDEHVTHKEAESELPKCVECESDLKDCDECNKCDECCSKGKQCTGLTTAEKTCNAKASCCKCSRCHRHRLPECTCQSKKKK